MQLTLIAGIFAIALYSTGFALQLSRLTNGGTGGLVAVNRLPVFVAGGMAVLAHVASASGVIYTSTGYHFGIAEISTLIAASISLLVLTSSLRKPLDNLFLGLFPLAVVAIILSLTVSSDYPPTELSAGMASHVLISILAYSFITIAAVQAGFLAYQNYQLKHGHAGGFLKRFPSLQDMEVLLCQESNNNLVPILPTADTPKTIIYFTYPPELKGSKKIEALRDFLVREVNKEKKS